MDQILKKYKNEIYAAIVNSRLGRDNFKGEDSKEYVKTSEGWWSAEGQFCPAFKVSVDEPMMSFTIVQSPKSPHRFHCSFYVTGVGAFALNRNLFGLVGSKAPVGGWKSFYPFEMALQLLKEWLNTHVRERLDDRSAVDLWTQGAEVLNRGRSAGSNSSNFTFSSADNGTFSAAEKSSIRTATAKLVGHIASEYRPSTEQLRDITARLEHIAVLTEKLGRFDWKNLFISTLIGIALNMLVDKEAGKALYDFFVDAVKGTVPSLSQF